MAKEHGIKCLLKVSDGGVGQLSGTTYGIGVTGQVYTLTRATGDFTTGAPNNVAVGDAIETSGFATAANNLIGQVSAVAATEVTFVNPTDSEGRDVVPVAEAAGASVTTKIHKFTDVGGQKNTRFQGQANSIDTSDKTTGGWGSSIAGTRQASVQASGPIVWPDTAGLKYVREAWKEGTRVLAKLVMNAGGDYWFGRFGVTAFEEGGSDESATEYSLTMSNATRLFMRYMP